MVLLNCWSKSGMCLWKTNQVCQQVRWDWRGELRLRQGQNLILLALFSLRHQVLQHYWGYSCVGFCMKHSGSWACRTSVICVEAAHGFQGGQNPFPSTLNLTSTNAFLWKDQTIIFREGSLEGFLLELQGNRKDNQGTAAALCEHLSVSGVCSF